MKAGDCLREIIFLQRELIDKVRNLETRKFISSVGHSDLLAVDTPNPRNRLQELVLIYNALFDRVKNLKEAKKMGQSRELCGSFKKEWDLLEDYYAKKIPFIPEHVFEDRKKAMATKDPEYVRGIQTLSLLAELLAFRDDAKDPFVCPFSLRDGSVCGATIARHEIHKPLKRIQTFANHIRDAAMHSNLTFLRRLSEYVQPRKLAEAPTSFYSKVDVECTDPEKLLQNHKHLFDAVCAIETNREEPSDKRARIL